MKKHSTTVSPRSSKQKASRTQTPITIGMDLGDKTSRYCVLSDDGRVIEEDAVATTRKAMLEHFKRVSPCRIAMEVGTHSPWLSRLLRELGHEVVVANARRVKLITESKRKNDRIDARTLARLARADVNLLSPIRHRGEATQAVLQKIRVRAALVETRTGLINTMRGLAKAIGERVPTCASYAISIDTLSQLPESLQQTLRPLIEIVEELSARIKAADEELEQIARKDYPETAILRQVSGVGLLIALTFMLTIEDPERFRRSREVGGYIGLQPRQSQSGESSPQLPISKEGDSYLRTLLVQGAHCVLSRTGPDTDLKRWGTKLANRGGKNARKRAVVAVARKLGILLHRLWVTGEVYEPLRNSKRAMAATAA